VVGIFPDRLPFLEATTALRADGPDKVVGWNSRGKITLRFRPLLLEIGMILANRHGLRSTPIVEIIR